MDMYLNHSPSMASNRCSIQDQILEVTVVSGSRLKDTEWLSRQDPYVIVQYGGTAFRTKTCKDGGTNPVFRHDKFEFKLIEGLRKIKVIVNNSNTFSEHNLIGYGKVDLQNVLSRGYEEVHCGLENATTFAGEIKLFLRYPNAHSQKPEVTYASRQASLPPQQQPQSPYPPCPPCQPQCPPPHQQPPSPYPPCPPYQPQWPPPQQQPPPTYPPSPYTDPYAYPPPQPAPTAYYPPPHQQPPPTYPPPPYSNLNVYPPPPAPPVYPPYFGYSSPGTSNPCHGFYPPSSYR